MDNIPKSLCDERTKHILERIDAVAVSQHETHTAVVEIKKLLLGNGERGVFEKLRDIEEWREKHQAQHATAVRIVKDALCNKGTARALAWIVGAALAALGVGGGLALWQ
jgi:hypothetical protein